MNAVIALWRPPVATSIVATSKFSQKTGFVASPNGGVCGGKPDKLRQSQQLVAKCTGGLVFRCLAWSKDFRSMNLRLWLLLIVTVALISCGGLVPVEGSEPSDAAADSSNTRNHESAAWRLAVGSLLQTPSGGESWQPLYLPGKRFAGFESTDRQGRPSLSVEADRSVSILRQRFAPSLNDFGQLAFSWKVDALPEGANLNESEHADAAVRILLAFDGDRSKWSPRNHRLSEMSRLLTGEELPYATLAYVWSNQGEPGSVIVNPRTDRIRKLVVESGAGQVGHWRDYRRDVRADFIKAFGEEPGPLVAVALMTDTDNTRSRLRAWYGPLTLGQR